MEGVSQQFLIAGYEKSPNNNAYPNYRSSRLGRDHARAAALRLLAEGKAAMGLTAGGGREERRQRLAQSCLSPRAAREDDGAATLDP